MSEYRGREGRRREGGGREGGGRGEGGGEGGREVGKKERGRGGGETVERYCTYTREHTYCDVYSGVYLSLLV